MPSKSLENAYGVEKRLNADTCHDFSLQKLTINLILLKISFTAFLIPLLYLASNKCIFF